MSYGPSVSPSASVPQSGHSFERTVGLLTIALPTLGAFGCVVSAWRFGADRIDLALLTAMYVITVVAVEVGYHRMIVHRSFRTHSITRFLLAAIGSMGAIGPIGWWTANHRQHHATTDMPGDPHSPHLFGSGLRSRLLGLWHSHAGWLLNETSITVDPKRFATDIYKDPVLTAVHRAYFPLVALGLLIPAIVGAWLHGGWVGAMRGLLWGGLGRVFCGHHAVWALGSVCHAYGSQEFETKDQARNNAWVAIVTFGEGWHHNHHVFPSSARHGINWWQLDPNFGFIKLLQLLGLAWDVKVPSKQAKDARRRAS